MIFIGENAINNKFPKPVVTGSTPVWGTICKASETQS
jgi:hypothetical protein